MMNVFLSILFLLLGEVSATSTSTVDPLYCEDLVKYACQKYTRKSEDTELGRSYPSFEDFVGGGSDSISAMKTFKKKVEIVKSETQIQLLSYLQTDNKIQKKIDDIYSRKERVPNMPREQFIERVAAILNPLESQGGLVSVNENNGRAYYNLNSIFSDYDIVQDPKIVEIGEQANRKVIDSHLTKYFKNYVEPRLRKSANDTIDRFPMSDPIKARLKAAIQDRVVTIKFCKPAVIMGNAFNDKRAKEITYCYNSMHASESLFTQIYKIGHEFAHSIGPCNNHDVLKGLKGLLSCLRSKESINAQAGMCGVSDQLEESFADWFAAEMLGTLISQVSLAAKRMDPETFANGLANVWGESACDTTVSKSPEVHPIKKYRVNAIILTQPELRERLGCKNPPTQHKYCSMQSAPSSEDFVEPIQ